MRPKYPLKANVVYLMIYTLHQSTPAGECTRLNNNHQIGSSPWNLHLLPFKGKESLQMWLKVLGEIILNIWMDPKCNHRCSYEGGRDAEEAT